MINVVVTVVTFPLLLGSSIRDLDDAFLAAVNVVSLATIVGVARTWPRRTGTGRRPYR